MRLAAAALLLTSLASPVACGGSDHGGVATTAPAPVVPARAATAGDPLLAVLPAGPDVVVELDLARLRANAAVGALVGRILDTPGDAGGPAVAWPIEPAPLRHAAVVVLASYAVGTADAATVTLLGGDALAAADVPGATEVAPGVVALAPPDWVARLAAAAAGDVATAAGDDALRALRAAAMPARADGAALRVTARLGFDARISLAGLVGVEVAPAAVSVWGDVADDLAVVAVLDGEDAGAADAADAAASLQAAVTAWLDRVAGAPAVRLLGLAPALRGVQIAAAGDRLRVVGLIGPRRLARVVARAEAVLAPTASPAAAAAAPLAPSSPAPSRPAPEDP